MATIAGGSALRQREDEVEHPKHGKKKTPKLKE